MADRMSPRPSGRAKHSVSTRHAAPVSGVSMSWMRTARHQHVTAVITACGGRVKCARIRKHIRAQMPSNRMGVDNLCGCRAKMIDKPWQGPYVSPPSAQVAELVDALASGASARKGVEVRVLSWAPNSRLRQLPLSEIIEKAPVFRSFFRLWRCFLHDRPKFGAARSGGACAASATARLGAITAVVGTPVSRIRKQAAHL